MIWNTCLCGGCCTSRVPCRRNSWPNIQNCRLYWGTNCDLISFSERPWRPRRPTNLAVEQQCNHHQSCLLHLIVTLGTTCIWWNLVSGIKFVSSHPSVARDLVWADRLLLPPPISQLWATEEHQNTTVRWMSEDDQSCDFGDCLKNSVDKCFRWKWHC